MAKFVMECPSCGKFVEAKSGFFAKRTIDCTCGYTINVKADKLTTRKCSHCGNDVVFDQSKADKAVCPVCHTPIHTVAENSKLVEFSCEQCGIRLSTAKGAEYYTCPVCDHKNNVEVQLTKEKIKKDGLASVIKYEGDADTLVWKHPIEDFNMGSQLIVHESQEAIFFRDGQALDTFGAGRYTLETQQLPILEKFYKLPTDNEGTFHSEVYFFNLINQMAIKWGTPEKINFLEPTTGAPICIGARGMLNFRIANARKLLLKLVGTGGKLTRQDLIEDGKGHITNYFRSQIQLTVSTNLANIITAQRLDILALDQQKQEMSAAMMDTLQSTFEEYGLQVTEFMILGITLPDKDERGYDVIQGLLEMRKKEFQKSKAATAAEVYTAEQEAEKQKRAAERGVVAELEETELLKAQYAAQKKRIEKQVDMDFKLQEAQIEAEEMRLKGYSQKDVMQTDVQKAYAGALGQMGANGGGGGGGMLGDIAGLGVTLGAMSGVMGMTRDAMSPMMNMGAATVTTPSASQAASPAATGWNCSCGAVNILTNFCPNCGGKKPEPQVGWNCTCGQTGITFNFCPNCGAKKPEDEAGWDCACGQKGIKSNFCPNCGNKKPVEDAGWDCACGQKGIKSNFCPNCGNKKPVEDAGWNCACGQTAIKTDFCPNCGTKKA